MILVEFSTFALLSFLHVNTYGVEPCEMQDKVRVALIATNTGDDGVSITGASVYRYERWLSYGI